MGANQNSRQRAIQTQLDSSNYCKFAHLLSFLGIEEQVAVIQEDPCSIFTFISNGPAQGHLIDFRFTRSMQKRHTRAQQCLQTVISRLLGVWRDRKQSAVSPQRSARSAQNLNAGQLYGRAYQLYVKLDFQKKFATEGFPKSGHIFKHPITIYTNITSNK